MKEPKIEMPGKIEIDKDGVRLHGQFVVDGEVKSQMQAYVCALSWAINQIEDEIGKVGELPISEEREPDKCRYSRGGKCKLGNSSASCSTKKEETCELTKRRPKANLSTILNGISQMYSDCLKANPHFRYEFEKALSEAMLETYKQEHRYSTIASISEKTAEAFTKRMIERPFHLIDYFLAHSEDTK